MQQTDELISKLPEPFLLIRDLQLNYERAKRRGEDNPIENAVKATLKKEDGN